MASAIEALSVIRANRRGFRARGATSQTLEVVETYFALKAKKGRIGLADVGRVLGVSRQLVHRHICRAEDVGMLVRIGRTVLLCARSLLRWSQEFVLERAKAAKAKAVKRWQSLGKSGCVNTGLTHTVETNTNGLPDPEPEPILSRQEARRALAATYVPVHLRKARQ